MTNAIVPAFGSQATVAPAVASGETCGGKVTTAANAITLLGVGLGVWWAAAGGPDWAALASICADELDGYVARARGEASCLGGNLDWAGDVTLAALTLRKMGLTKLIPVVAAGQAFQHSSGWHPPLFVGVRAWLMVADILLRRFGGAKILPKMTANRRRRARKRK